MRKKLFQRNCTFSKLFRVVKDALKSLLVRGSRPGTIKWEQIPFLLDQIRARRDERRESWLCYSGPNSLLSVRRWWGGGRRKRGSRCRSKLLVDEVDSSPSTWRIREPSSGRKIDESEATSSAIIEAAKRWCLSMSFVVVENFSLSNAVSVSILFFFFFLSFASDGKSVSFKES